MNLVEKALYKWIIIIIISCESASTSSHQEESDGSQSDHSEPMPATPVLISISDDDDGLPKPDDGSEEPKQPAVLLTLPRHSCSSSDQG